MSKKPKDKQQGNASGQKAGQTPDKTQPDTEQKDLAKDLKPKTNLGFYRDVFRYHGDRPRGADFYPKSPSFEGRFGRMFRTLPAAQFEEDDLKKLAALNNMVAPHEDEINDEPDAEENSGISAGYTYFGQFIDHDLTFDPASSLQKQNDPDALVDFRTPRFDLDCVYGRGPDDQPYLYDDRGVRMLLGRQLTGNPADPNARDLPRNDPSAGGGDGRRRALIGDPRNDENVIVSQLQATMLRFHNKVVSVLEGRVETDPSLKDPKKLFETAQRTVRWHYQWAVLNDFLPTIVGPNVVNEILPHLNGGGKGNIYTNKPDLRFFHWRNEPFIPIEFSAAAYRFGHSMVRPFYRLNSAIQLEIFGADENSSLTGFRDFPSSWGIDWSLFFKMTDNPPEEGPGRLQPAYKIDTSLVNPLGNLPGVIAADVPSLAERNLIRGWRMGLPSGQSVARFMHLDVIPDDKLRVGKATEEDSPNNPRLTDISPRFRNNAPLWYYVLAEAQQAFKNDKTAITLGPVGGRIVAEVFIGLMLGDPNSFLAKEPSWRPLPEFTSGGNFGIAELIRQAISNP